MQNRYIRKDIIIRKVRRREEMKRHFLKWLITNLTVPFDYRFQAQVLLAEGARGTQVVHRCLLTGRGRALVRRFALSRLYFRQAALAGLLPGVRKSSW